jgi:2-dehydro-3-deoxyglucarate aldolase/4-hydroxy-2-oxoheptanedioate aldolase
MKRLNERVLGIIQIESVGGLRDADAIAAIDGVDVLFVGPADLSHSLGIPGQFGHDDYLAALDRVLSACRAHGKAAGILVYDTTVARHQIELGFTFVGIGADAAFVASGAAQSLAEVRS